MLLFAYLRTAKRSQFDKMKANLNGWLPIYSSDLLSVRTKGGLIILLRSRSRELWPSQTWET